MSNENELVTVETPIVGPLTPSAVKDQVNNIQLVMRDVMKDGEHFGKIDGLGEKKILFKAGAEKLSLTFRLLPKYDILMRESKNSHREYEILCTLVNPSGQFMGQGVGLCSTMESKYRYRNAARTCPECGQPAIIKGKHEWGGGWLCFKKKDGCGAKFEDGSDSIEKQPIGKIENEDLADTYNTVLKMGKKRAFVDGVISATAASDIFSQDVEDIIDNENSASGKSTEDATQKESENQKTIDGRHRLEIKQGLFKLVGVAPGVTATEPQVKLMREKLQDLTRWEDPQTQEIHEGVTTTINMSGKRLSIVTGMMREELKRVPMPGEVQPEPPKKPTTTVTDDDLKEVGIK